jgi:hypothetical protein
MVCSPQHIHTVAEGKYPMKAHKSTRYRRSTVKRFLACAFLLMFAATWIIGMFIPGIADIATKLSPLIPVLIPIVVYYFKPD